MCSPWSTFRQYRGDMIFPEEIRPGILSQVSMKNLVVIHSTLTCNEIRRDQIIGQRVGMDFKGTAEVFLREKGRVDIVGKHCFVGEFFNADVWVALVLDMTSHDGNIGEGDLAFCGEVMRHIGALDLCADFVYKMLTLYGFNIRLDGDVVPVYGTQIEA
jgi:hypothetical protein